jgi:hypothetical protein
MYEMIRLAYSSVLLSSEVFRIGAEDGTSVYYVLWYVNDERCRQMVVADLWIAASLNGQSILAILLS